MNELCSISHGLRRKRAYTVKRLQSRYLCVMSLFAWGRGEDGQVGIGDTCDQVLPVAVEVCFYVGCNQYGSVSGANSRCVQLPLQGIGDLIVTEIACGSGHTIVLSGMLALLF